jgi:hypothetical protein
MPIKIEFYDSAIFVPLIDEVKKMCRRLVPLGWRDLLLQHGLDIAADDLKSELLKELPKLNRGLDGFQDFVVGKRGIEPSKVGKSLLYYSFASPYVLKGPNGIGLEGFPTLGELDTLENYIYGIEPPTFEELKLKAKAIISDLDPSIPQGDEELAMGIVVFASEFRPGAQTPHKKYADVCFSRTGLCRIGTFDPLFDSQRRGFLPFDDNNPYLFRVLPARYSAYVAIIVNGYQDKFGPIRQMDSDKDRKFWVPIHKLFSGQECIKGLDLKVELKANHVNEKIKRVHLYLEEKYSAINYPKTDKIALDKAPYRFTEGIAEFSTASEHGGGLLVPIPHDSLVKKAEYDGSPLTFLVPPEKGDTTWSPSLQLPSEDGVNRRAPEFIHVRHALVDGLVQDLNDKPDVVDKVIAGNYEAVHYVDYTGDGWIEASCVQLKTLLPRTFPAYSLVTAPDFYPNVDEGELKEWYSDPKLMPQRLRDPKWIEHLDPLSDQRFAPNIELNYNSLSKKFDPTFPFDFKDPYSTLDTVSAIISMPIEQSNTQLPDSLTNSNVMQDNSRHSCLPDAASGVFAPGWDVGRDRTQNIDHLAAYGLGSPFPEDTKLCAALSSYWPSVSPDSGRSFMWLSEDNKIRHLWPTVSPLTDQEIGQVGNIPWDGFYGPKITKVENKEVIEYLKADHIDYVNNMLQNKFTMSLTGKIDNSMYKSRILSVARVYEKLGQLISRSAKYLPVLSFDKVSNDNTELAKAQGESGISLNGDIYRIMICEGFTRDDQLGDYRKILFEITIKHLFFVGSSDKMLYRRNIDPWITV